MDSEFESLSGPTGSSQRPCSDCKILDCQSIHGPVARVCLVKDCYFCTDIALTDIEISAAYKHLYELVQKRVQTIEKPHHDTFIHRLPVEILSLIFGLVKSEAFVDYDDAGWDDGCNIPNWFKIPSQSPHLLVGAVCKRWREITLNTPTLWTDITVDIAGREETEVLMANEWARRAGTLPLNLTIFLKEDKLYREGEFLEHCEDIVMTLRSLAGRWNDLALRIPWSYCLKLLNDLEESPSIHSLFYATMEINISHFEITLRSPLSPKYLYLDKVIQSPFSIPLGWDNLQHLEVTGIGKRQLLYIIDQAQNLRHCVADRIYDFDMGLTAPITRNSLIHLKTTDDVMPHLTLPFLQHLEYSNLVSGYIDHVSLDPFRFVEFTGRSCPPLRTLKFKLNIWFVEFNRCLENLAEITHLTIALQVYNPDEGLPSIDIFLQALTDTNPSAKIILPRLQELTLNLPLVSSSSWLLLRELFLQDVSNTPVGMEDMSLGTVHGTLGRLLSKLHIITWNESPIIQDKDTFLYLLSVRKSGVDLDVKHDQCFVDVESERSGSFFDRMAEYHHVNI